MEETRISEIRIVVGNRSIRSSVLTYYKIVVLSAKEILYLDKNPISGPTEHYHPTNRALCNRTSAEKQSRNFRRNKYS